MAARAANSRLRPSRGDLWLPCEGAASSHRDCALAVDCSCSQCGRMQLATRLGETPVQAVANEAAKKEAVRPSPLALCSQEGRT